MDLFETARQLHTSGLNALGQGVLAARLDERDLISITSLKCH